MTDRRSLLSAAGLTTLAAAAGLGASGCSKPIQVGTGATTAQVPADRVPVGGGIVLTEARFVVTQPSPGVYKAFDRACTHSACPVSKVEAGAIVCTCHGTRYSIADGSVLTGPATRPLPEHRAVLSGGVLDVSQ